MPVLRFNYVVTMLHNPNSARKAQDELDKVVGRGRIPTFDDEKSLPYLVALIKETLRCVFYPRTVMTANISLTL